MNSSKMLKICEHRNGIELLYKIARAIAESDSIGEGYPYCRKYSRGYFKKELNSIRNNKKQGGDYVEVALDIYGEMVKARKNDHAE